MTELDLAQNHVEDITERFRRDLDSETIADAVALAARADEEYPINRSPTVVATIAIYLAASENGMALHQQALADAAGIARASIYNSYPELAEYEGIDLDDIERATAGEAYDYADNNPMTTTITISEALKAALEDERDKEDLGSLDATIRHVIEHPESGARTLPGYAETLTEPIKVRDSTKARVKSLKEMEGYADYEAVLRERIGAAPRDTGEEPVDVRPLS